MKVIKEYIQGAEHLLDAILYVDEFKLQNAIDVNCFYPMDSRSDGEDKLTIEDIEGLDKQIVQVCDFPGTQVKEKELYVDEHWAYLITEE